MKKCFEIYTDGSCKDGRGSWAYLIVQGKTILRKDFGRCDKTSSHRMEFQAAIEAMKNLPPNSKAVLYSDFKVLIETVNRWIPEWSENDWLKENGLPCPNSDQVKGLHHWNEQHQIQWRWIRAHSGVVYNEYCDQLCLMARS